MAQIVTKTHLGIFLGNLINHFEHSLFGWMAPIIAVNLFPEKNFPEALFYTLALLPLGYLAIPLGSLFWGIIGDRFGRRPMAVATQLGLSLVTILLGLIPLEYQSFALFCLFRLFQGFFYGGESRGTSIYYIETIPLQYRARASSYYDAVGILGTCFACIAAGWLGNGYWRELFCFSGVISLVVVLIRFTGEEPSSFTSSNFSFKSLWKHRNTMKEIAIVSGISYGNYYMVTIFLNALISQVFSINKTHGIWMNAELLWIDFFLLLGFGHLSKWIAKEKLMLFGIIGIAFGTIPMLLIFERGSYSMIHFARFVLVIFGVALAAPFHAWKVEKLPEENKVLIGGISSTIGAKCIGAPIPFLASYLYFLTQKAWVASLPILVLSFFAFGILTFQAKKQKKDLFEISL
jgi:MFS family permease